MKYKALFSDFDNTLAGGDLTITPSVAAAIRKITEKGIVFCIATGRAYEGIVADICRQLGLKHPIIAHNGAEIMDPITDQSLHAAYIPDEHINQLLEFFYEERLMALITKNGHYYGPQEMEIPYGMNKALKLKTYKEVEFHNIPQLAIPTIYSQMDFQRAERVEKKLLKQFPDLHVVKLHVKGYYGMDITSLRATKHIGLLEVMKMLKLTKEEVIAAGDNYNDFPLLTAAGVKVAMSDAPQELKDIADFIAPSQKENGMFTIIEKYFPELVV